MSPPGAGHAKLDAGLEGHDAAGIDAQQLVVEALFDDGAAGVHEGFAVAGELLQNEAFAAKQAGPELLVEVQADLGAAGGGQETVFLHDEALGQRAQIDRNDGAGVRGREGYPALAVATPVREVGEKQALAGDEPATRRKQLAQDALVGRRAIAHLGFESDGFVHVHHGAGLGDNGFLGVQFYFKHLNVGAENAVINVVGAHGK